MAYGEQVCSQDKKKEQQHFISFEQAWKDLLIGS